MNTKLLIEKLEKISGKKVRLREANLSDIADRTLTGNNYTSSASQKPTLIQYFINFNLETDHLTKTEYIRVKEAVDQINFTPTPGAVSVQTLVKDPEVNPEGKSVYSWASENGTPVPYPGLKPHEITHARYLASHNQQKELPEDWVPMTTIMKLLSDDTKIPKSYVPLMNPLEKRVYDSQFLVNPDAELRQMVKDKLKAMKDRIAAKETKAVSVSRERESIKGKLNPNLRVVINDIGEQFRVVIEEDLNKYFNNVVNIFNKKFPNGASHKELEEWGGRKGYNQNELNTLIQNGFLIRGTGDLRILVSDVDTKIKKIALEQSHSIIVSFINKMYDKLGGFLTDLDKEFEVTHSGTKDFNNIHFKFSDGSRFSIKNQVVSKWRSGSFGGGTHFYAYPTTFHDAYLGNGQKIDQPSESTIKRAFLTNNVN